MKDVDVDVSVSTKGTESNILKEFMRKGAGATKIRDKMAEYVAALKTEYSTGLILPKKGVEANGQTSTVTSDAEKGMKQVQISGGVKIEVDELKLEETMKCTGQELFNALTQRDMIQVFTGSSAKMEAEAAAGGTFELLGGGISGKYIE